MDRLRITWCYPDMLNLHGDRGNLMALERVAGFMGLNTELIRVRDYGEPVDWDRTDLLFLNPGEVRTVQNVVDALQRQREGLNRYVAEDGVIVAIGTTGAAFGRKLRLLDGSDVQGLGILPMDCAEREEILGDDLLIRLKDSEMELAGCQIQMIDVAADREAFLGEVLYGYGNNGYEKGREGARYRNVFFTNLLGPVLAKNPWWAEALIRTALQRRGDVPEPLPPERWFAKERKSLTCIRQYCLEDHLQNKSHNPWNRSDC